jgi:hypothetical protein
MVESAFEFKGKQYEVTRIPPKKAFHIARRAMPLVTSLKGFAQMDKSTLGIFMKAEDGALPKADTNSIDKLVLLVQPIAEQLAELSDEHADYLINNALTYVKVATGGGVWTTIYNQRANDFQVTVTLAEMLYLTGYVLVHLVADFLADSAPNTQ